MNVPVDVSKTVIQTERLTLRPLAITDLQDFYAYASVPGVGEMAGWKHHDAIETSRKILLSMIAEKNILALVHKEDHKVIGTLGLHESWANDAEAYRQYRTKEIGYVLGKAYWGQGLMPEAVRAVIGWAFETLPLDALTCCHFSDNQQSRRVIEKCGFQYVRQGTYTSKQLQKTFEDMQYILMKESCTPT